LFGGCALRFMPCAARWRAARLPLISALRIRVLDVSSYAAHGACARFWFASVPGSPSYYIHCTFSCYYWLNGGVGVRRVSTRGPRIFSNIGSFSTCRLSYYYSAFLRLTPLPLCWPSRRSTQWRFSKRFWQRRCAVTDAGAFGARRVSGRLVPWPAVCARMAL